MTALPERQDRFVRQVQAWLGVSIDGDPGPRTLTAFAAATADAAAPATVDPPSGALSAEDYARAASRLGVEPAAIAAVARVEAGPWGAFLPSGHPVILFERHLFSRYTRGRFDAIVPDLSSRTPGGYGRVSEQPARLARARQLDAEAAVRATSYGLFQVLGDHWQRLGYDSLADWERRMRLSVQEHLEAFVRYIEHHSLDAPLRALDWTAFARGYNGPAQRGYDDRIAAAYRDLVA